MAVPGLLLPALGNIGTYYVAPLIVAQLAGRLAGGASADPATVLPYVLGFAGVLLAAEVVNRVGLHGLNRADGRGIEHLYVVGMNELLAKDAAFFQENFAGSLTKRVLSFATRFEEFVDTLAFSVVANVLPLLFAAVVLWGYDPRLVAVLVGLIVVTALVVAPLIRRRQALVDQREAAVARVSGQVADSLLNMETVRAFAAEDREAAEHRERVAEQRVLSIRSWDYGNLRIDTLVAPMLVLTNALGLLIAVGLGNGRLGVEAHCGDLRLLHQRQPDHVRVQPDLPAVGEFADRGRPVHRAAADTADRARPEHARSRCARPRPTSASSG